MGIHEESAIIGFWRMGAPIEQISWVIGIHYFIVERVITNYKNKNQYVKKNLTSITSRCRRR